MSAREPLKIDEQHDDLDKAVAVAQMLATVATLMSVIFLGRQILQARTQAQAERALAFQQRYTSREFAPVLSRSFAFFAAKDATDCLVKMERHESRPHADAPCLPRTPPNPSAPQPSVNDVDHVLGFFEDLGTARNRALLDDEVFVRSFGHAPVQMFMAAWWYICWARHGALGHEARIFGEFEKMVRWLRETESFADTPNPAIRLLVLPGDPETAGSGTWSLCRDLSQALSEYPAMETQRVREGVGATIQPLVATGATGLFSEVVAVPPLDVGAEDWTTELEEASRLLDHLQTLDPSGVRTLIQRL